MHSHDQFTVDTLPAPVLGEDATYWNGDTQYTLKAMPQNWILYRHRYGRAHPLGLIRETETGWRASGQGTAGRHIKTLDGVLLADALLHLM